MYSTTICAKKSQFEGKIGKNSSMSMRFMTGLRVYRLMGHRQWGFLMGCAALSISFLALMQDRACADDSARVLEAIHVQQGPKGIEIRQAYCLGGTLRLVLEMGEINVVWPDVIFVLPGEPPKGEPWWSADGLTETNRITFEAKDHKVKIGREAEVSALYTIIEDSDWIAAYPSVLRAFRADFRPKFFSPLKPRNTTELDPTLIPGALFTVDLPMSEGALEQLRAEKAFLLIGQGGYFRAFTVLHAESSATVICK